MFNDLESKEFKRDELKFKILLTIMVMLATILFVFLAMKLFNNNINIDYYANIIMIVSCAFALICNCFAIKLVLKEY
ncbi:hypothetical protein HZY83_01545 [Gemella sp. GH3]|uniref:hypothetical protein n=1 Tax=unclassified Gemella TaxID=2624949 RepID=UPI0015D0CBA8|nr:MULTISPECIES: hypothetical protein [unclassified Gemella]MBF0713375.1 hypothetical protein [Gemella sp. GH3.1]NYS50327.1 hypothetical protein [Gemella sp. GH3]